MVFFEVVLAQGLRASGQCQATGGALAEIFFALVLKPLASSWRRE